MIKHHFQRVHNFCKQKGSGFRQFLCRNDVKIQPSFFESVSAKINFKKRIKQLETNGGGNSKMALGQRWLFHYVNMILLVKTR